MEGRHKPPKAEHPFPDNVNMSKLWGTPMVKPFLKSFVVVVGGFMTFAGTWLWLHDDDRGPFGLELRGEEEVIKGFDISKAASLFQNFTIVQPNLSKDQSIITSMFFDDGRKFVPPKDTLLTRNVGGLADTSDQHVSDRH